MVPKQQRVLCRAAFVLFCLLPTFVHLWTLFAPSRIQVSNHKSDKNQTNGTSGTEVIDRASEDPEFTWTRHQEIGLAKAAVAKEITIQKSDLPESHWLRRIASATISVRESPDFVQLSIPDVTVSRTAFEKMQDDLLQGEFDSVLPANRRLVVKIERLKLRRFDAANLGPVCFRDVQLELGATNGAIVITGRRVNGFNTEPHDSPHYPFRFDASWTNTKTSVAVSGLSIPVWILGNGYSDILGDNAELHGELKSVHFANRSPSVQFAGRISGVNCQNLTAWLNTAQVPMATGACEIACERFVTDDQRVREFDGEIQSSSSGTINAEIAKLLGSRVHWTPVSTSNSAYRSFLFDVSLVNDQLKVESKFDGNPLVWTAEGNAILIAK